MFELPSPFLLVSSMSDMANLKVAMVEANPSSLGSLGLEGKDYGFASEILRQKEFEIFYECRTSVLTQFQRELYEKFLSETPRDLAPFLDPIILSFALKDACDFSGVDYVWLDLEEKDEIGNSAWLRKEDQKKVLDLAIRFLERHLEKYIIDAYDRRTRDDMVQIWEAQVKLQECPICRTSSLERRLIMTKKQKLRGWTCSSCGHHIILPSDALEYLGKAEKPEASK